MNQKVILGLSALFLILLAASTQSLWLPLLPGFNQSSQISRPEILDQVQQLGSLTITKLDTEYTLEKTPDSWVVGQFPADSNQIDTLIQGLNELAFDRIASTNPDNFATYNIASDSAILLTLTTPDRSETFQVGSRGTSPGTFYLKPEGQDIVYLAKGNLRDLLSEDQDFWRDKTLVNLTEDQIGQIEINRSGITITISQSQEGAWQAVSGNRSTVLGDTIIDRLTNAFDPLQGSRIATAEQTQTFTRSAKQSMQLYDTNQELALDLSLVEAGDQWLVQSASDQQVYTLSNAIVSSFFLSPNDIFVSQ